MFDGGNLNLFLCYAVGEFIHHVDDNQSIGGNSDLCLDCPLEGISESLSMAGNRINADRITVAKPERVGKDMLRIRSSNPNDSRMMRRLLAISFFGSGFVALNNKVLVELGLQDQRAQFLFIVYLTGLIIGLLIARPKDIKLAAKDWQVGIFMGITGIGAAYFLIQALLELQGIIVFPVRSSANLLLTALVSAVIWKERPGKKGLLGIILGAISIILINIK